MKNKLIQKLLLSLYNSYIELRKMLALIALFLLSMNMLAQNTPVKGVVKDASGETLIGVTVKDASNATVGTMTDAHGVFSLSVDPSKTTLQFTYVGYSELSIKLDGKTELDVVLKEDTKLLDEVVVVGYGVVRKSDLTGSVSSVKGSDLVRTTPVADISSALQGRLPGVSVVSGSGQPGSAAAIQIRGANSLMGDTSPLIVVDGMIGGSLSSINPSDIASVEVLKDASATAVYGSRGANGVILVTTRTPTEGKITVSYNGYINVKTPYSLPSMMSSDDLVDVVSAFHRDVNKNPNYYTGQRLEDYKEYGGYDYVNAIFRDVAIEQTHELSISGGSKASRFLFSGSYTDNDGTIKESNQKRFNYRLKLDSEIKKWLKAGFNFWGDYTKTIAPIAGGSYDDERRSIVLSTLTFPNTIQPFDKDGKYNNTNELGSPQVNPRLYVDGLDTDGYKYMSKLEGYLDVELLKGLTLRTTQGFTFSNYPKYATHGNDSYEYYHTYINKTGAVYSNESNYGWLNTNILSYVKEFNENHRINATAVLEQQYTDEVLSTITGTDLIFPTIGADNPAIARQVDSNVNREKASILSYMGRINYALMNRYMLTASIRRDGSSRLTKENQWENFASGALAWNVAEERFIKDIDWVDQLKLRVGYGEVGNQTVPIYRYTDKYKPGFDANDLTITKEQLGSPLKWERTKQYNVGLDLGFLKNRLTATIDVYSKETEDVLLNVNTPMYTGFSTNLANIGTIQNKGFEIDIKAIPVITKDLTWSTGFNISRNKGILKSLNDGSKDATMGDALSNLYFRNIVGEKLGTMFGYISDGVWTTDEVNAITTAKKPVAGSYKYKDTDGKEGITPDDRTIIGNGQPAFQWGWNNSVVYKDFDFSVFIIGVHGFDIYNYTKEARYDDRLSAGQVVLSASPDWNNRWQAGVNENSDLAGFVSNRNVLNAGQSKWIEKGDFVKVKSITLGYTIPKDLTSKLDISQLRVYFSAQNPFMITSYSGIDPEVTLKNPIKSGMDYGYYPNGRNYLLGLNLTF